MKTKRRHGSGVILYVENDPDDIFLLRRLLTQEQVGNPVQTAHDGDEAISYLSGEGEYADRTRFPLPVIVLLDLKLTRKDGFQVLAWIREDKDLRLIPVIVLSSSYLGSDITQAYRLGANAFIVKPFDYDELREVARFLRAWLRTRMLPPRDERDWMALIARDLKQHWPNQQRPLA